ncbi:DUF4238 domain-containing protein [Hydrogenophaga sp.]|uniref:DUF4238 domain-containing protein n=1 Tax=Hydrogenophaga sp. TaxID=1904254 RepID=UPI0027372154|nr:DUF4238 domain-containing protein [Hydrogenophaga sp.]
MAVESRIHHYIPQAYLRGFGWKRGKNWYVNAADLKKLAYFQPNTKNICAERDFMRFEIEGQAPDKLENEIGQFEHCAREAILNVEKTRTFEGEDRIYILNLIALLAVRSPQMRENMRDFQERVMKQVLSLTLATKERWEGQMDQLEAAGKNVDKNVAYEQVKEFHKRGEYKINVRREFQIGAELQTHKTVLDTLAARKWRLFWAGEGQGTFVTTDHPVVLTWNRPVKMPALMRHSPGFAMVDTELIFPLTHSCCLLGCFEGMDDSVEEAHTNLIAQCNTRMISHAFDYAFMLEKSFPYIHPPDEEYWDGQFMDRRKEHRE